MKEIYHPVANVFILYYPAKGTALLYIGKYLKPPDAEEQCPVPEFHHSFA